MFSISVAGTIRAPAQKTLELLWRRLISAVTRSCRRCESDVNRNGSNRERAGYFVGIAVGLRLAQVTAMRDKAIAREQLLHRAGLDVTE